MTESLASTGSIVLYAPELDPGLRESIESLFGDASIRCTRFTLDDWLQHLGAESDVAGVVIDTDSMGLGDLRTVGATLKLRPQTWCLMLVGDRGIAGFENLLKANNISILPKPWTPQGLQASLASFSTDSKHLNAGSTNDLFLSGLVEGLRDPMTCISGGLQMMRMGGDGAVEFVDPAMRAALQISEQLQYIELAATDVTPHFDTFDLADCALSLKKDLAKLGYEPEIKIKKGISVYSEPNFACAALKSGFLLLHRFGLDSAIELVANKHKKGGSLVWQQQASAELAADNLAPPPYLEELISRLAQKAQAEPVIEKLIEVVPHRVGLLFSS